MPWDGDCVSIWMKMNIKYTCVEKSLLTSEACVAAKCSFKNTLLFDHPTSHHQVFVGFFHSPETIIRDKKELLNFKLELIVIINSSFSNTISFQKKIKLEIEINKTSLNVKQLKTVWNIVLKLGSFFITFWKKLF